MQCEIQYRSVNICCHSEVLVEVAPEEGRGGKEGKGRKGRGKGAPANQSNELVFNRTHCICTVQLECDNHKDH